MRQPKVPNTISDAQMDSLRKRANKLAPPMFDPNTVKKRKAASKQKYKAEES